MHEMIECHKTMENARRLLYFSAGFFIGVISDQQIIVPMSLITLMALIIFAYSRHLFKHYYQGGKIMGSLAIIDLTGDTKVLWDKRNQAEVDNAKATFKRLKKAGYIAYSVKDNGDRGEIIHAFDVNLERIIMHKPIVGG